MLKHMRRTLPIVVVSSLMLTGCFKKEEATPPPPPQDKPYSISELKTKYGTDTQKTIMPMYNVSPKEEFTLHFKSFMGDVATQDIVSVHTEPDAGLDSRVDIDVSLDSHNVGATTLKVKPVKGVLDNKTGTWGNVSMLYLKLEYDLDTDKPSKLEKPIIVPFSVKSGVKAPALQAVRGANGNVELRWTKVQGADSYMVYAIIPTTLNKKVERPTTLDAFRGYEVALLTKTKETKFSDWGKDGKNGVYSNTYKELVYQNKGFKGDYFVVAVDGKKQSLASTIVSSSQFLTNTPYQLVENINETSYENVRSLPKSVTVEMLDGSTVERKVDYNASKVKLDTGKPVTIPFTVYGTVFKGSVKLDKMSAEDKEVLDRATADYEDVYLPSSLNKSGRYANGVVTPAVFDNGEVEDVPDTEEADSDTTVVESEKEIAEAGDKQSTDSGTSDFGDFEASDKDESGTAEDTTEKPQGLFMTHKLSTEQIIASADKRKVVEPAFMEEYGVKLNVNSAVEEYVGLSMLNGANEISLSAFPAVQTYTALDELMSTVLAQNPLLLGVKNWTYDYVSRTLTVDYKMTSEKIREEQVKLLGVVKGYIDEAKVTTLSPDAVYDKVSSITELAVLEESSDDDKKEDSDKEDSDPLGVSDATGVWVYGKANSLGYAKGYKLLADMTGVESIVIGGEYNLKPHWWNKVKSDGQWLNVDSSLNDKTIGIPYKVYLADDSVAKQSGLTQLGGFWYSSNLLQFSNESGLYDYYARNGLLVDSVEAYAFKLKELLATGSDKIVIRVDRKLDSKRLYDATGSSLQQVVPDKLATARFTESGNFVVLDTTPLEVEEVDNQDGDTATSEGVDGVNEPTADGKKETTEAPKDDSKQQ